jgi:hypothetical protein
MQDLFVSLGAGAHQIPLIEAARAMGYMVVAVDKNLDAPGFEYAHERIQRSILRPASIRRRLEAIAGDPVAIVARSYGKALISSAALSDHLGLQGPGVQAVRFFQNKSAYKSILEDAGILVPRRFEASQIARIKKDIRLIARPVSGHGKLGIEILETRKDRTRFAGKETEGWLIEELVSGTEVTVLGASHRGSYRTLLLTSKRISQSPPHFAEIMHRYPALISPQTKEKIDQICAKIVEVSGLRTSPLVSEFIVTEEESIKIQKELGVPVEVGTKADAEKMIEEAIKGKKHLESNKNRGSGKGLLQRAIDRYAKPQVDWKSELRRIIGKMVTRREEYFGKRKYLHRDEYVYGERVSANTLKDAIMAVDTSGSIGDDELRVMLGEIAAIIKSKKIHRTEIVYFDAALQGHDVVKNPPQFDWTKATGGGGTSFIPPIDYIAQQYKRNKMELCVFCTDGYGDQEKLDPKPKFAQKFIWLIIDNPGWVPPFGKVVYVKTKKGK